MDRKLIIDLAIPTSYRKKKKEGGREVQDAGKGPPICAPLKPRFTALESFMCAGQPGGFTQYGLGLHLSVGKIYCVNGDFL